jgi:hypothetical protein
MLIEYTGYVTHATDQVLWHYRETVLTVEERNIALAWLRAIDEEVSKLENSGDKPMEGEVSRAFFLHEDKSMGWDVDHRFDEFMRFMEVLE